VFARLGVGRAGEILGTFAGGYLAYLLSGTAAVAATVAASPFALLGATVAAPLAGAWLGYRLSKGEGLLDIFGDQIQSKFKGAVQSKVRKRILGR
jgi:hypothetical protein